MTIKQQIIYLPVNNKNADYLLKTWSNDTEGYLNKTKGYFFNKEELNEYTANVIKSTLETAVREAKVVKDLGEDLSGIPKYEVTECYYDESDYPIYVEAESILNVFEEVYQKLKV